MMMTKYNMTQATIDDAASISRIILFWTEGERGREETLLPSTLWHDF